MTITQTRSKRVLCGRCILVPVDFSPASRNAFATVPCLLGPRRDLVLLHVVPPSFNNGHGLRDSMEAGRKNLKKFVESLGRREGAHVKLIIRAGTPFQEILAVARDHDAGLIVLGIDDSDPLGGLALGHTADRISRYATSSVLLVRSGSCAAKRATSVLASQSR